MSTQLTVEISTEHKERLDSLVKHFTLGKTMTVRELADRAFRVGVSAVPEPPSLPVAPDPCAIVSLAELESQAIKHAMTITQGNKLLVSRLLGIGKTTLYRKLDKLGMSACSRCARKEQSVAGR